MASKQFPDPKNSRDGAHGSEIPEFQDIMLGWRHK